MVSSLGIGHQIQLSQGQAIIAMEYEPWRVQREAQNNVFNEGVMIVNYIIASPSRVSNPLVGKVEVVKA